MRRKMAGILTVCSHAQRNGGISNSFCACAGKWRERSSSLRLEHDEGVTLACAAALVKKRVYRDLVDFDNHLDDLSQVELFPPSHPTYQKGKKGS
jgi:hypothetical protein